MTEEAANVPSPSPAPPIPTQATPTLPVVEATAIVEIKYDQLQSNRFGVSSSDVVAFFLEFLDAFNKGDIEQLQSYFPARPTIPGGPQATIDSDPVRYGVSVRSVANEWSIEFGGYEQQEILGYVEERHQQGERLEEPRQIGIGPMGLDSVVAILFEFTRTADDLPEPMRVTGKMGIHFATQTIVVMIYNKR